MPKFEKRQIVLTGTEWETLVEAMEERAHRMAHDPASGKEEIEFEESLATKLGEMNFNATVTIEG